MIICYFQIIEMGFIVRFRTGAFYIVHWNFQLFCFILVIYSKTINYQIMLL
jgi:hypothetical protein